MAIVADTLYVTDIDCVRRFHRVSGEEFLPTCVEGAGFLNDLAATPQGDLYVSDSGTDTAPGAVYLLRRTADVPQQVTLADGTVLAGEDVGGPNGLFVDERGLFVATWDSGEVFRVNPDGERIQLFPPSQMQLDGFVSLEEWGFLFSSWGDSAVYWTTPDGNILTLVENVESPADLGYDAGRNRALIPLFMGDALMIVEVR
jgi:sugar lactone lactonase YvrE